MVDSIPLSFHRYADPDQQENLVRLLWQQWPAMSSCGHKAAQFVDLLGFLTISAPQVLAKVCGPLQFGNEGLFLYIRNIVLT